MRTQSGWDALSKPNKFLKKVPEVNFIDLFEKIRE